MTQTKRIILNVAATYGRSFITLFMGLFSARWVLEALGETDFGLYGVVGSVIFFVTFLNTVLSMSMTRFYSYSIGAGKNMTESDAHNDLKGWFNTALSIHLCLPLILITIGYPVCAYALDNWLVIPPERMQSCVWVLRMSFACAFVSMVSAPYVAMFTAYQYITELVVFTLLQTTIMFGGAYALLHCPGDRLIIYAALHLVVYSVILILQVLRARRIFVACRVSISHMFNKKRLKEVFVFSGMKALGGLAWVLRGNGSAMLLNIAFGPKANAALTVSTQLSGQAASFSGHLIGAMTPAVTTAVGAGESDNARSLTMRCCKFGALLVIFFGIPLIAEMEYFLTLWLKTVPLYAKELCSAMILVFLFEHLTNGHQIVISAHGKITVWQTYDAIVLCCTLPIGWGYVKLGAGVPGIGYAYLTTIVLMSLGRLYFAKKLMNISIMEWTRRVLLPLTFLIGLVYVISVMIIANFEMSFWRLCLTSAVSFIATIVLGWLIVLEQPERMYILTVINKFKSKILRRG